jgi:hypothetical protein
MSMIIYVVIDIETVKDIQNNRQIGESLWNTILATCANQVAGTYDAVNVNDVSAALSLHIELRLNDP